MRMHEGLAKQLRQLGEELIAEELLFQQDRNRDADPEGKLNQERTELRGWRMQLIETEWKLHQLVSRLKRREESVKNKEMELISYMWAQTIGKQVRIFVMGW